MEDMNQKAVSTLEFMHRYGNYEFVVENGRVSTVITEKGPVPASKQDP